MRYTIFWIWCTIFVNAYDREYYEYIEGVLRSKCETQEVLHRCNSIRFSGDAGNPLHKVSESEDHDMEGGGAVHIGEHLMHIKAICSQLIRSSKKQQKLAFQRIGSLLDSANSQGGSSNSIQESFLASAVAHIIERFRSSEIEAIISISLDNARFMHALSHSAEGMDMTKYKRMQAIAWLEVSQVAGWRRRFILGSSPFRRLHGLGPMLWRTTSRSLAKGMPMQRRRSVNPYERSANVL
jgi:hypothetical protein